MAPRKLGMLIIVFAVLLGAVFLMSRPRQETAAGGAQPGDAVFPGLDLNAVQAVRITGPGGTGTVARKEGAWVVTDLHDYPADFSELRRRLRALGELKIGQVADEGANLLDEYGLGANAARVTLQGQDGDDLAALTIGSTREGNRSGPYGGSFPDGQFIRAGEGPVLLVAQSVGPFPADGSAWIKKQLLEVPSAEIARVTVTRSNETYTVDFSDGHVMEGLAEDEEINTTEADRLSRALQYLSCVTVAGPSDLEDQGFEEPSTYVAETKDGGIRYTVRLGGVHDDGRLHPLSLDYEPPAEITRDEGEAEIPEGDGTNRVAQVEAKLAELKTARDEAIKTAREKLDELAFLEDWTYVISTYSADSMDLGRDKVVNKVEPPEEEVSEADVATEAEPVAPPPTP